MDPPKLIEWVTAGPDEDDEDDEVDEDCDVEGCCRPVVAKADEGIDDDYVPRVSAKLKEFNDNMEALFELIVANHDSGDEENSPVISPASPVSSEDSPTRISFGWA